MSAELEAFLARDKLTDPELDRAFAIVMDGEAAPEQLRPFLLASIPLMSDPRALAAGARAMRARMVAVAAPEGAIDVCGTGGDGAHTLNVSTAVAFVVAGAGVPVAKHGNRAMSSKCGAADVLEALGVKLTADIPTLERTLRDAKIAFLFAQNHHPAMRHVAAARKEIGQRTIFNLLGPLSNPARVKRQLMGVFGAPYVRPAAEALRLLGAERAWVIYGAGGLDELSIAADGENLIDALVDGDIAPVTIDLRAAGVRAFTNEALRGGSATENAAALTTLLAGQAPGSAYETIVLVNAGAALVVEGRAKTFLDGYALARESLHAGRAAQALDALRAITNETP